MFGRLFGDFCRPVAFSIKERDDGKRTFLVGNQEFVEGEDPVRERNGSIEFTDVPPGAPPRIIAGQGKVSQDVTILVALLAIGIGGVLALL